MYFCHSKEIWDQFPQLVPGLLIVSEVNADCDTEALIQSWFQRARERLNKQPESKMPEISAWRKAYSQMGLKPTKYRSAAEALLRRFKREDDLPRLHPLVDLCNAVSIAYSLPVAVFDLEKIEEFIEVCHANGSEEYHAFSGEIEKPSPGEVIFRDSANQVHARRWTFRQSKHSIVSPQTQQVLIISEGLHESASSDVRELIEKLSEEVTELGLTVQNKILLSAENPRLDFEIS
jgi:DNA/RNA-binding domain of Phe-tRNA-synthetase-like protein